MISKNQQYRTADGERVRIYATDGAGTYPVHGAVRTHDGWRVQMWTANGEAGAIAESCGDDLIEIKPRIQRRVWINVCEPPLMTNIFGTWEAAKINRDRNCVACIPVDIDCEEGEGL
jgi:hypothetical protein